MKIIDRIRLAIAKRLCPIGTTVYRADVHIDATANRGKV